MGAKWAGDETKIISWWWWGFELVWKASFLTEGGAVQLFYQQKKKELNWFREHFVLNIYLYLYLTVIINTALQDLIILPYRDLSWLKQCLEKRRDGNSFPTQPLLWINGWLWPLWLLAGIYIRRLLIFHVFAPWLGFHAMLQHCDR